MNPSPGPIKSEKHGGHPNVSPIGLHALEPRLLLAASPLPVVGIAPATNDLTPLIGLQISDDVGFGPGSTMAIDIDLNNDGDFDDAGELAYQVVPVSALTATTPLQWRSKFLPTTTTPVNPDLAQVREFGRSIAVSGNRAVVGAPAGFITGSSSGEAYVFEFDGTSWQQVARLQGSDTNANDQFGYSVAIDGDTIVVGAVGDIVAGVPQGSAYVFNLTDGQWTQTAKLNGAPGTGGRFGVALALNGATLVVGEPSSLPPATGGIGRVHVFEKDGAAWNRTTVIGTGDAGFGFAVALDNGLAVIRGSIVGQGGNTSRIYTLEKVSGSWTVTDTLDAPAGTLAGGFGDGLRIEGSRLMAKTAITDLPAAAIYRREAGQWVLETILKGPAGVDLSSGPVAMSGDRVVIASLGTAFADRTNLDSFEFVNGAWVYAGRLTMPVSSPGIAKGFTLAMVGNHVLAGSSASQEFFSSLFTGAAYAFEFDGSTPTRARHGSIPLSPALPEGEYALRARVTDIEGRTGTSAVTQFVIDTTAPLLDVVTPANGATIAAWTASLRFTFDEALTAVDVSDLLLAGAAAAGATVTSVISEAGGKEWVFAISGLVNGPLSATLAPDAGDITDLAGNALAPVARSYTVLDNIAPTVTALSPAPNAVVASGGTDVLITFSENVTGLDATDLVVSLPGGAATVAAPVRIGDTNQWRFTVGNLTPGNWTITLAPDAGDVTDGAGNSVAPLAWTLGAPGSGLLMISPWFGLPTDPAVAPAVTNDSTPSLAALLNDPARTYAAGTTVSLDVDLNGDGDFLDPGEAGAATGPLQLVGPAANQGVLKALGQGSITIPGVAIRNGLAVVTVRDGGSDNTDTYAHVYQRTGDTWSFVQQLSSTTGGNNHGNRAVAMNDSTIVIGTPLASSGKIVFFELVGGVWTETALLGRPASTTGTLFGQSLSMEGDLLAVGMPSSSLNNSSGAVFLYQKIGGTWTLAHTVVSPDGQGSDFFGSNVALSGNRLVVGAEGDDDKGAESGSVHVFDFNGTSWVHAAKLLSAKSAAQSRFGASVALDGDTLVAGALSPNQTAVYERIGGSWTQTASLADDESSTSILRRVAIDGQTIVVDAARGYVFQKFGDQWLRTQKVSMPPGDSNEYFEGGAAIDGNDIILGARVRLSTGSLGSGAQVFQLQAPGATGSQGVATFNTPALADGVHMVRARVSDTGGNTNGSLAGRVQVDAVAPAVASLSIPDGSPIDTSSVWIEVTFTEPVTGVDASDLVLSGNATGARSEFVTQLSPTTWRFRVIGLHNGPLNLTLAPDANDIESAAGNDLPPTPWSYEIEDIGPLEVLSQWPEVTTLLNQTSRTLEFYFAERVKGVDVTDLVLTGPAAALVTIGTPFPLYTPFDGGSHGWAFQVQNLRSGELHISLAPDAGDIVDMSNVPVVPYTAEMAVDLSPVPTSGQAAPELVVGSALSVRLFFQIAVATSFDPSDVVLSGSAAASAVVSGVGPDSIPRTAWTISITGLNDGDLTVTVAPDAGDVVNEFGDDVATITRQYIVTTPPQVVTALPAAGAFLNQTSFNIDIRLNEAVSALAADDLELFGLAAANATVAAPFNIGNNTWRFLVSGLVEGELIALFAPHSQGARDASGNLPVITTLRYIIDTTAPAATIVSPVGPIHTNDFMSIQIQTTEPMIGWENSDIVLTGAAAVGTTVNASANSSGGVVTLVVQIGNVKNGDLHVSIAPDLGDVTDRAGNPLNAITRSYNVDLINPTITGFTPAPGVVAMSGSLNFDVTFSEPVAVNSPLAMTLSGAAALIASVGAPVQLAPDVWRFPVTGLANGALNVQVSGGGDRIEDAAGRDVNSVFNTYTLQGGNAAPTKFFISSGSVPEGQPAGTLVGLFTASDANAGDTHTYTLVPGDLSEDNNSFVIVGNQLRTNAVFDFDVQNRFFIRVRATDQGGLFVEQPLGIDVTPAAQDAIAPVVTRVQLDGSTWSPAFRNHLLAAGLGAGAGYTMPGGAGHLKALPWNNVDRVVITFSEHVDVAHADLALRGVNIADYSIASFTYDPVTFTAAWTFAAPIGVDKLLIALDPVADAAGNPLDGEWGNGLDTFPSGNGAAGGQFLYRFNMLPGDASQDGGIYANDIALVRAALFQLPGSPGHNPMFDVNGSGSILIDDAVFVRNQQPAALPVGEPTPPPAPLSSSSATGTNLTIAPRPQTSQASHPLPPGPSDALHRILASIGGRGGFTRSSSANETSVTRWRGDSIQFMRPLFQIERTQMNSRKDVASALAALADIGDG